MDTISGIVIHGKHLGRTIGFPTANIALPATSSSLHAGTYGLSAIVRGKKLYGIGVYLLEAGLFEAHFFDFDSDIYGETISVTPLFLIRENQKFTGIEDLKRQIENDKRVMLTWLREIKMENPINYIAIAAMAQNRVIGNEWKIPWHIPEDFRHFRETTKGHPIIMGRKTFESIGRILPGRENIVLTRGELSHEWLTVLHSVEELDTYLVEKYNITIENGFLYRKGITPFSRRPMQEWQIQAYVCWGSQIYEEFFQNRKTDEVILSVVDMEPEWDAYFPHFEDDFMKVSEDIREGFTIEHWKRK